jgi:asparagine synthase (glutamine-hydrolysing)
MEPSISMTRSIRHRGPDDEGFVYINTHSGRVLNCCGAESDRRMRSILPLVEEQIHGFEHDLAFSHRRFSIVDLSPSGHQPMWDEEGEICVSFNGEIYNYVELRSELINNGHPMKTQSDTEVILRAYRHWGTGAFSRLNGPWAIALYDKRRNGLLLSRDRIGKAPLYSAIHNNCLYFASEIKALLAVRGNSAFPVREQSLDDYIVHGWRDLDGTFWSGIDDFPPAAFAWVQPDLSMQFTHYWNLPSKRLTEKEISISAAASGLSALLEDATRMRLRADVPVAFELSGGMDSSSLVALTARCTDHPISTYTVKFDEKHSDEEPYAKALYERYADKIDYHVIRPGKEDFWSGADLFFQTEEEPFHSPNLFTLQSLRRMIRNDGIKVVIAGSAGDEVLAGYQYEYYVPYLAYLLRTGKLKSCLHEMRLSSEIGLGHSVAGLLKHALPAGLYDSLRERRTVTMTNGAYRRPAEVKRREGKSKHLSQRMADNMTVWMMNYWLRSGNKASFGIPIEPRSPFLDYRVVDFAFSLPPEYLIRNGWHKWILREATKDLLPDDIVWRQVKMGFPFPWREWLRQSKDTVAMNLKDIDCPYVINHRLMNVYDDLAEKNPPLLWRIICLSLWWRKIVEQRPLLSRM